MSQQQQQHQHLNLPFDYACCLYSYIVRISLRSVHNPEDTFPRFAHIFLCGVILVSQS